MNKRIDAIKEVLEKNEQDTVRWKSYVEDNETAAQNIEIFNKRLTVDVMIPVGNKAFFPGYLKHTNEILVSHSKDYFSRCSAHTAIELCKKRIEQGKLYLKKLENEKDLFRNKLEVPLQEGVFPNEEEREIIEEYDEEKESIWKKEHRQRVREAKLKEKDERNKMLEEQGASNDIFNKLNDTQDDDIHIELTEVEAQVFQEAEEITKKLMNEKMCPPIFTKRTAHNVAIPSRDSEILNCVNRKIPNIQNNASQNSYEINEDIESDISDSSDVPEEIQTIERQGQYLPPSDRIEFYNYQLQIVNQMIKEQSLSNADELEKKLKFFKIRYNLEELIETLEEAYSSDTDATTNVTPECIWNEYKSTETIKKHISFAKENETLEFKPNECVTRMFTHSSKKKEMFESNTIPLNDQTGPKNTAFKLEIENSKTSINNEEKTKINLKTQNGTDMSQKNKMTNPSKGNTNTLCIHFQHSSRKKNESKDIECSYPISPEDIYNTFYTGITNISNSGNDEIKNIDNRHEFTSLKKSILKNKNRDSLKGSDVNEINENSHIETNKLSNDYKASVAYSKVIGDVIENLHTKPDTLKERSAALIHTPNRRISRFKNMRNRKDS